MLHNYHTHTPRCNHARGTEEEYVRAALEAGLQTLGFSDHTPYPFPKGYTSTFRMGVAELPDYANSVRAVQKQFAGQIDIRLGVEAEFYPAYFADLLHLLQDHGVEYMILGQHMVGNEIGEHYLGAPADATVLERYCDQCIEAIHTGLFTYFAHPDLVHFIGDFKTYRAQMRRICQAANACGLPLEYNLLGLQGNRHYPNPIFWEIAAEENCAVILGRDAHDPQHLLDTATEEKALAHLAALQLPVLENITIRAL